MKSLLVRSSIRYIGRHPWLFALSILGVAMGVAVVVAIDTANSSARRAFELSTEAVAGRATHHIQRPIGALPDSVYRSLRVDLGFRESAPIVEGFVRADGRVLHVLGIDPLAEDPFRGYTSRATLDLGEFMTQPVVIMSTDLAAAMEVSDEDSLAVYADGNLEKLKVISLIEPADERARLSMQDLLIVDVSTAQTLFGLNAQLTGIDLLIDEADAEAVLARIESVLPTGATIERSAVRTRTLEQMTRAFEINLSALSMLALVVGMFLIFNSMTFSVVQRRRMIGRLRAIGVTSEEISRMILGEALIVALLGTLAGFAIGFVLAKNLVALVTQTINDLYFVVNVSTIAPETATIVRGLLMGVGAMLVAAYFPAREAAGVVPAITLQRSTEEDSSRRRAPGLAIAGALTMLAGSAVLLVSGESIIISYVGLMALIAGFVMMVRLFTIAFTRIIRPVAGAVFGLTGRMAARALATSLSRLSVAIAALTVAIAATIGVGVMVESFRDTVDVWLNQTLQADIYIQPPTRITRGGEATLQPEVIERIRSLEGIDRVHTIRSMQISHDGRPANLVVMDADEGSSSAYKMKEGGVDEAWRRYSSGEAVLVSEPFSFRSGLATGDTLTLPTDLGEVRLPIGGVYYDYGTDLGVISIARSLYERHFSDRTRSGVSLTLQSGVDVDDMIERVRAVTSDVQDVTIRSNRGLRETSLEVFDRTFRITTVLRVLTIFVAFIGVLSAFMSIQLEKQKEVAVMRAQGFTRGQVRGYVTLQSTLGGILAGLLALPLGLILAVVLVYVINKRSFGWTLQFMVPPQILLEAVLLAVVAAFLASLYPAWRTTRTDPGLALRDE